MITSSSKDSSAARIAYAPGARAALSAGERVTSLTRDRSICSLPLREISKRTEDAPTLPVMATTGDVRELVRLLKRRSAGVTIVEAMSSEQKRIFDPRKIAAYEFWGIVDRDGERLKLTPLGFQIARQLEPEAQLYRTVLDKTAAYRSALEWVFHQGLALVTHTDVAAYWHEQYTGAIDVADEKGLESAVVCFFHLCQAAELGTVTIGKRGQPARLHVERRELADYIRADAPSLTVEMFSDERLHAEADPAKQRTESSKARWRDETHAASADGLRLLISHGKKAELVDQIRVTLGLADIESSVVERKGAGTKCAVGDGPVAEHILRAMRQCDAAIIIAAAEDCSRDERGAMTLNEDVMVEIGAAFVFYDRRVVLLWEDGVPVPSNLQNLSRCRFERGGLTWDTGLQLMSAIIELKD